LNNSYGSRIYILETMGGLLRICLEGYHKRPRYITTRTLADQTHARKQARTPNKKEKLNGRKIRITLLYRSVRKIPFGINIKTVRTRKEPGRANEICDRASVRLLIRRVYDLAGEVVRYLIRYGTRYAIIEGLFTFGPREQWPIKWKIMHIIASSIPVFNSSVKSMRIF